MGTEAVVGGVLGCISDGGWVLGLAMRRPPDSALIQTHHNTSAEHSQHHQKQTVCPPVDEVVVLCYFPASSRMFCLE